MADFKVHMMGAAIVSGVAATALAMGSQWPESTVMGCFILGVVGGLLPDVDSESSIPVRIAFTILSVIVAFLVVFALAGQLSLIELTLLGLSGFLLVRYGVFSVFAQITVHRGLIHSIPAGVVAGMLTAILAHSVFEISTLLAWTYGSFVCGGFLVHLILDEMYSVDLLGRELKRSFGSAFNLGSFKNLIGTIGLYLAIAALYQVSPDWRGFWQIASNPNTYNQLENRIWPSGQWFAGLLSVLS